MLSAEHQPFLYFFFLNAFIIFFLGQLRLGDKFPIPAPVCEPGQDQQPDVPTWVADGLKMMLHSRCRCSIAAIVMERCSLWNECRHFDEAPHFLRHHNLCLMKDPCHHGISHHIPSGFRMVIKLLVLSTECFCSGDLLMGKEYRSGSG